MKKSFIAKNDEQVSVSCYGVHTIMFGRRFFVRAIQKTTTVINGGGRTACAIRPHWALICLT